MSAPISLPASSPPPPPASPSHRIQTIHSHSLNNKPVMGSHSDLDLSPSPLPILLQPTETILPSSPTDSSPLPLSLIDQCVAYVVDTVYFYPNHLHRASSSSDDLLPRLRQALSDILVPYHFLAGRLRLNPSNASLHIDCNRQGALFAAASCDLSLADLGDVTFPNPSFRSLVLQAPVSSGPMKMVDSPLLMMQVTTFKCGGFCIGFSMNHAVFDGQGALEFVMNFSSLCRGAGLVLEPKPDRSMFKPRNPPEIKFEHPEFIKLSDIPSNNPFTTADVADLDFSAMTLSQKHIFKIFRFSGEMLDKLKTAAMSGDSSLTKCTSFDAIAAHVWQARTKAVGMPDDAPSKVLYAVDIRKRIQPPLPAGFVGNGILSAFACVPAKELKEGSLSMAVKKIQESAAVLTDEYVRSAMDWGSIHGGVPNLPGGIFLSAWWKLPFFLMDFGWGKPVYAGPVVNAMVEFVLLLSNGTQEGLNIYIALEPEQMEVFERLLYEF